MMRKRATGGGRKPSPHTPRAQLTVRMPEDMRAQLEAAARKHGGDWTLTDELVGRIRTSFLREREQDRDPAMRALCFLVSQLARHIVGPGRMPAATWRSDPFFYEAFKIAVGQLLNALTPPGRAKRYKVTLTAKGTHSADEHVHRYAASFQNTEARAAHTVDLILSLLREIPDSISSLLRDEEIKKLTALAPSVERQLYGMADAARDLAIRPQSNKKTGPEDAEFVWADVLIKGPKKPEA